MMSPPATSPLPPESAPAVGRMRAGGLVFAVAWRSLIIAIVCGAGGAIFLDGLHWVTSYRESHPRLVWLLPAAGALLGAGYYRWGKLILGGTNMVVGLARTRSAAAVTSAPTAGATAATNAATATSAATVTSAAAATAASRRAATETPSVPAPVVAPAPLHPTQHSSLPLRLAPMVVFGTWLTHLFGGSAGREGTAVQMGAGLASAVSQLTRAPRDLFRTLIVVGIAGGFGAVFGTPLAATVFAVEVVAPNWRWRPQRLTGRRKTWLGAFWHWRAWQPALPVVPAALAAVIGDRIARGLGAHHAHFAAVAVPSWSLTNAIATSAIAIGAALIAYVFIRLHHLVKRVFLHISHRAWLRLALGGAVVLALYAGFGPRYLGLGADTIVSACAGGAVPPEAFVVKLLFTVVTLGAGFIGGEVTPLFFIGATFGAAMAPWLAVSSGFAAALGLACVFAAAARVPFAMAIMVCELCGIGLLPYALCACLLASALQYRHSLYPAAQPK